MFRSSSAITLAALMVMTRLTGWADELTSPPNLVEESSLEGRVGGNGLPLNWEVHPSNFSTLSAYLQPGSHTGQRCLRLQSTGEWGSVATPRMDVQPGAKQVGRVWYRPASPGGGLLMAHLKYFREDRSVVGISPGPTINLAENKDQSEWRELKFEYVGSMFAEARTFNLTVGLHQPGTVLLDDFSLCQILVVPGASLVPQGDMELPAEEFQRAFTLNKPVETVATLSQVEDNPHGGKKCLRLSGKGTWAFTEIIEFEIPPGKTIHGAGWKRANRGDGHFRLYAKNDKEKVLELHPLSDISRNWQETRWKLSPEQLGRATRLSVGIATGDDFDVYFDDISIWVE